LKKQENQSSAKTRSYWRKTGSVREFFTAKLATVALSPAGFRLVPKWAKSPTNCFSVAQGSQNAPKQVLHPIKK